MTLTTMTLMAIIPTTVILALAVVTAALLGWLRGKWR
jgi:hypothetical protein